MKKSYRLLFLCSSLLIQSSTIQEVHKSKKTNGKAIANKLVMDIERWKLKNAQKYIAQADKIPGWFHDVIILETVHGYFTQELTNENKVIVEEIFNSFWTDAVDKEKINDRCIMYQSLPMYEEKNLSLKTYLRKNPRPCTTELATPQLYKLAEPIITTDKISIADDDWLSNRSLFNIYRHFFTKSNRSLISIREFNYLIQKACDFRVCCTVSMTQIGFGGQMTFQNKIKYKQTKKSLMIVRMLKNALKQKRKEEEAQLQQAT